MLPPKRDQDYAIVLKEGAKVPNIHPYKYPHYQKNEREKIVTEMMQAGIIRHIVSPFCSLIILERKKDGGCCFSVDYQALNKITIPDKFPIHGIQEPLEGLSDSKVFTKLDLKSRYHLD